MTWAIVWFAFVFGFVFQRWWVCVKHWHPLFGLIAMISIIVIIATAIDIVGLE